MLPLKEKTESLLLEALAFGASATIEAQEARGQQRLNASATLPHKFNSGTREQLERMGVVYGAPVDDLFSRVTLPTGWRKQARGHAMWSDLLDAQGRLRASIFYKAAFYDRDAFVNVTARFSYGAQPILGYDDPACKSRGWIGVVRDCDEIIWQTPETEPEPVYDAQNHAPWLAWDDTREQCNQQARAWLDAHYPEWQDPCAYWE